MGPFYGLFKDCCPPSTPDLNSMDYFVWGHLETHTNRRAQPTKASFINSIMENSKAMDRAMVARACTSFRGQVEAFIEAEGGFYE